ncbi:hypothetical protein SS50377_20364 [Spironucleus salmonicida]|uniref:Uncharacterized protein n=1 Tax=Spironucleus salmonicida TaxID=348837 RepID=V6LQL1_9EUKA|nr:hypothetical protein SS50377_20364 [Spironucleus salmonicida]|eukprot:EST43044.1 Hypothetical protein SS50377_17346 [Spironucleus salmonicida]
MLSFQQLYISAILIYIVLISIRVKYYIDFIPKSQSKHLSKEYMIQLRKSYSQLKSFKNLEIAYITAIIPLSKQQSLVYDIITGTSVNGQSLIIVPELGSIHSLIAEITAILPYFQHIYILNRRIFSPFYRQTTPIHSACTADLEYLLNKTKTQHILILGDCPSGYRISTLRPVRVAQVQLDLNARRLKRFNEDRKDHLKRNSYLNLPVSVLENARRCDSVMFGYIIDRIRDEGNSQKSIDRSHVFEIERRVKCQGGMNIVAAGEWLIGDY